MVGDVGEEEHARFISVATIDMPELLSTPAGAETLVICRPCPLRARNGMRPHALLALFRPVTVCSDHEDRF